MDYGIKLNLVKL